jgi:hypothetical protein
MTVRDRGCGDAPWLLDQKRVWTTFRGTLTVPACSLTLMPSGYETVPAHAVLCGGVVSRPSCV